MSAPYTKPHFNTKYELGVEIDGVKQWFTTNDPAETLLEMHPHPIKGKILITLERGEKKAERLLFVMRARRIFNNRLSAQIFTRDLIRAIS